MGGPYEEDTPATRLPWWELVSRTFTERGGGDQNDFLSAAGVALVNGAIDHRGHLRKLRFDRWATVGCFPKIMAVLEGLHAHRVFDNLGMDGESSASVWIWNSGVLVICPVDEKNDTDADGTYNVDGTVLSVDGTAEEIARIISEHTPPPSPPDPPDGQAYVLCDVPMRGTEIVSIGLAGQELLRGNYTPPVLKQFDRAVRDLQSRRPCGRLVILDGPPGTGKTYMVRAFMAAVPESKFVVVPPHLVKALADPNLILTFIREISAGDGSPLVLILEDADQCLSKRKAENMASISAILNLSDGIIGSLLDLRVLATTNTPAQEFDEALLRKGRMSAHIQMGALDDETIRAIWERLAGKKKKVPDEILCRRGALAGAPHAVLADVYAAYNELPEVEKALGDIDKLKDQIN